MYHRKGKVRCIHCSLGQSPPPDREQGVTGKRFVYLAFSGLTIESLSSLWLSFLFLEASCPSCFKALAYVSCHTSQGRSHKTWLGQKVIYFLGGEKFSHSFPVIISYLFITSRSIPTGCSLWNKLPDMLMGDLKIIVV